jgi:xylose dehydrogenase (NAD/NADP)
MPDRVRWGLIGAARIAASQFIPAVRASRRGEVRAVAARDPDRARAFAAEHAIPVVHRSYEDLLADPDVDAVYVATPNRLHAEWTIRAAAHGKHVFCEKPFASDAEEALRAVEACERAGVVHVEAFVYRYHPQTLRVRSWLAQGAIGEVRTVHAGFAFVLPEAERDRNIRTNAALAGGSLMDVGCYAVSWLRFVFGEEPEAATARAVWDVRRGVETTCTGMLHFSRDRAGTLYSSFDTPGTVATRVVGTDGEIVVTQPYHPRGPEATVTLAIRGRPPETHQLAPDAPTFLPAVEAFHEAVLDGRPLEPTARDAVGNMAAIDALLASARAGGQTVRVSHR